MPSTYLSKTYSGNGNRNKGTISVWCKFSDSEASADSTIFGAGNYANDSDCTFLSVNGNGFAGVSIRQIVFTHRTSGGTVYKAVSDNLLRDVNAWYHIVVRWDTTLGTPNCDIYLNGEEVSYSSNNWSSASQNMDTYMGSSAQPHYIGRGYYCDAMKNNYMDGCLSHMHYCDGYYYDASTFGSTDATTGEWKINTSPSVSYGTNGFFFFKNDNALTDHSPNSNSYSLTAGTLTKTEDSPSNVFATLNPLATFANITLGNGNNTYTLNAGTWESTPSTMAVPSSGKYYAEFKWNASSTSAQYMMVGVDSPQLFSSWSTQYPGYTSVGYAYGWDGDKRNNGSNSSYGAAWGATSIIGVAIDMDNKKLYFHKDGVYQNSGVPTSGSTGTGALSLTGDEYYLIVSGYKNSENPSIYANFGNGYFGTTAVSSAGTNASNLGIFEYDVPSGYTALCTKGLNL